MQDRGNASLPVDMVKILKTQDENYVRTMRAAGLKVRCASYLLRMPHLTLLRYRKLRNSRTVSRSSLTSSPLASLMMCTKLKMMMPVLMMMNLRFSRKQALLRSRPGWGVNTDHHNLRRSTLYLSRMRRKVCSNDVHLLVNMLLYQSQHNNT